jgi:hypothetical protein
MDLQRFFWGIAFFIAGLLMLFYIKRKKPASEKTNWQGQWISQYIHFWITAIMGIIVGLVFIIESLAR